MPRAPLRMPKMSMTMEEGELGAWLVEVGETVELGQVMCEVATDKVDMEVEATAAGTVLELLVEPGTTVPVGAELAWIDSESDSLLDDLLDGSGDPAAEPPAAEPAAAEPPASEPAGTEPAAPESPADGEAGGIVPAIPQARRLATENSLDLRAVAGTGPNGAVMVEDVRSALTARTDPSKPAAPKPDTAPVQSRPEPRPVPQDVPEPAAAPEPVPQPPPPPGASQPAAVEQEAWASRAAALAPRPSDPAGPVTAWRDVVLGAPAEIGTATLWTALGVALARSLAAEPPRPDPRWSGVAQRPRVGFAVPTPAGPVTVTIADLHRMAPGDALDLVTAALDQARGGHVDVALLAAPDAVLSVVPETDRLSLPAPFGTAVAIGAGSAVPRVVAVGVDLAVRTTVCLSATAAPGSPDPGWVGRLMARMSTDLPELTGMRPS